MQKLFNVVAFGVALVMGVAPAQSADMAGAPAPVIVKTGDMDWPRWIVRLRATGVWSGGTKTIWAGGGLVPGGEAKVSRNVLPELDVSYFLTRNFALSVNATASRHGITGAGTIGALGVLGRATVMAPALTLQYHLTGLGPLKPYVGAGGTHAFYFNHKNGALQNFKIGNTPGAVLQVGVDWMFTEHLGLNIDLKKYYFHPTSTGTLGPVPVSARIRSDPWLAGVGLSARF